MAKNVTLAISDQVYDQMKAHPEIRWSEVARQAIESRLDMLDTLNAIGAKSKLTSRDVEELGEKIRRAVGRRHGLVK